MCVRAKIINAPLGCNNFPADPNTIRSYEMVVPVTIAMARPLILFGPLKERMTDLLLQDPQFATCVPRECFALFVNRLSPRMHGHMHQSFQIVPQNSLSNSTDV